MFRLSNGGHFEVGTIAPPEPPQDTQPTVIESPSSSTDSVGITKTLSAKFGGNNLEYQWYRNGSPISGAKEEKYLFLPKSSNNGDEYYCTASNSLGTATTSTATLELRPRIYFNTSIWNALETSTTLKLVFKSNGFIDIITSEGTLANFDSWVSPTDDSNLPPFNLGDYQVRTLALPSYLTKVGGSIDDTFKDLSDGMYLEVRPTGLEVGESGLFKLEFQDKKMPGYNWAGWDEGDVFLRKIS